MKHFSWNHNAPIISAIKNQATSYLALKDPLTCKYVALMHGHHQTEDMDISFRIMEHPHDIKHMISVTFFEEM